MTLYEYYYDFKFGSDNSGYFTITSKLGHITQFVKFVTDGKISENLFELKHDGKQVISCKVGDGEWLCVDKHGEGHYPGSAYPLFLPKVKQELTYISIDETSGEAGDEILLKKSANTITETRNGQLLRQFEMRGDIPYKINWGGPISTLHDSCDNAKACSPFQ